MGYISKKTSNCWFFIFGMKILGTKGHENFMKNNA